MDSFNYHNIFDTKGFEYIAIIAFFLVLIPFWIMLNKQGGIKQKIKKALRILTFDVLKIPQGIFHSKNHTWVFMEKSGTVSMGLDDFLLHTTGEVTINYLKNSDETIHKGDIVAEVIRGDKQLKIYSPITGTILSTNSHITETPELLNSDPYGKGWVFKIKPDKWLEETQHLFLAEQATNWSKTEMLRFKDFLAISNKKNSPEASLAILQDGGELMDHPLSELPNGVWMDFQESFLKFND